MASRHGGSGAGRAADPKSADVSLPTAPRGPGGSRPDLGGRDVSAPPSRDPTTYAQTDHFRQRLCQQGRYVTLPTVGEAIRRGQLRWNTSDGWRFALVEDGVRYVIVVGDTETPSPVLVTGWTEIADWDAVVDSDRWSELDAHTIRLRADLSSHKERQIPGRIRPRVVSRAFEIGGHRVATAAGEGFVECADCGGRFRSKRALRERHCQ
ncbi:hypothetical protein [Halorarum halobium]|uniref:hypothetical protein n=1 Tax=Halorarum halobium TaxID=3075121 RepID=UPI0028AB7F01|nr:hypothetical protein [Halobaculum sp. XH14]